MKNVFFVPAATSSFHVLIKDNNCSSIFYEKQDYQQFIDILNMAFTKYGCMLHSYVFMQDHLHLLAAHSFDIDNVDFIKLIERQYSEYFNFTYRRLIRLIDLDYSIDSLNVDNDLLSYYRFIEFTPVRTGTVAHLADYPWSSYGSNAFGEDTGLLTPHDAYMSLGRNESMRWRAYQELFEKTYITSVCR
jgi:putative transposase